MLNAHQRRSAIARQRTVRWAALLLIARAAPAAQHVPRFSNGSSDPQNPGLSTGPIAASGAAAQQGWTWSELQRDASGANAMAGVSCHPGATGGYRIADDFAVAGSAYGWSIASISLYAYVTNHPPGSPDFTHLHLRIWSGTPGEPASEIVWDNADPEQSGTSFTVSAMPMNRIFHSGNPPATPADSSRKIWRLTLSSPGLILPNGSYWLDWQVRTDEPAAAVLSPLVTIAGARGRAGANALQLRPIQGDARWIPIVDAGKPAAIADVAQELPFLISAGPALPPCPGDGDGNGVVNFADIASTLTYWGFRFAPESGPGDTDGSGVVDFADVTTTLFSWGLDCP